MPNIKSSISLKKKLPSKFLKIRQFLIENAAIIEEEATKQHLKFVEGDIVRAEFLEKTKQDHIKIVIEIANHLDDINIERSIQFFNAYAQKLAQKSIKIRLRIQESVDGTLFLKQAIWKKIEQSGLIDELTTHDLFQINQIIGTYIDTIGSKLAFAYHEQYKNNLQDQNQRLYDLLMQAPAAIALVKGPSHIFEVANGNYLKLIRKDKSIIGKTVSEVLPEVVKQGFIKLLDNVYQTGKPFVGSEMPFRLIEDSGKTEEYFLNFIYQPIQTNEGIIEGIFVHAVDVTKQVEARLKIEQISNERENDRSRLEFGQKAGRIGTYEWDIVTNKSIWTKEFEALYGYPNGGYQASNIEEWLKYIHPDDRRNVMSKTEKALKKGKELNIEYRVIWPDNRLHYLSNRAQIIRNKDGKAVKMNGVNIDITERKLVENNLAYLSESSKQLASTLDYKTTLANVAKLAVPQIADWCSVTIKNGDKLEQLAVAHVDPKKVKWAKELNKKNPPQPDAKTGIPNVLRTGRSELYPNITKELIIASAKNNEDLELLLKLQMSSIMIVPLLLKGKAIGAISFIAAESGRHYTQSDLNMAQEVASRMTLAIENARLYEEAKNADEIQKRLAAVVESSDDAIISKSLKGVILTWNKGAERLYGYKAEEIIGKPVSILMPPEKKDDFPMMMRQLQEGKKVEHYETRRKTKYGKILDVSITVSPIRDLEGKIIGASKIARDITERKQIEERQNFLEQSSQILGASIDYEITLKNLAKLIIPFLADYCRIVVVDSDKKIKEITVNHLHQGKIALVKKLYSSYRDESANTAGVERLIKSGESERIYKITPQIIKSTNPKVVEIIKQLNLQSYMGVPMKIGNRIVGVIIFSSIKPDRLYSEADLFLAEQLAQRAALAIENARLYTQSKEAVAIRDEFISVASHELKTPVTSLKLYLQVSQKQLADKGVDTRNLEKMDIQINKLMLLIQDLLNVSKFHSGILEYHDSEFDLSELVKEVVDNLQPTTKHKLLIDGKLTQKVRGDKDRISQVLINLLTNAIKYSPKAQKIIVHLKSDRGKAQVTIEDFGIGIAKENINKLFERFYRVTGAEEKTYPGLGLGLYISNEIIKRYNGKIKVTSALGKGSKFSFSLPSIPSAPLTPNHQSQEAASL